MKCRIAFPFAAIGLTLLLCAYLVPGIGGPDFFYYLVNARDVLAGDGTDARYAYFPGVYWFWALSMWIARYDFWGIQLAYFMILVLNALLIVLILRRLGVTIRVAITAFCVYLIGSYRLEGYAGCTEPLVSLCFLLGIWIWDGRYNVFQRNLVLGVALGLALFSKQQGLLIWGGLLTFPMLALIRSDSGKLALNVIRSAIVISAGVLTAACLFSMDGGLHAFRLGLGLASTYSSENSLIQNLAGITYHSGAFALIPLLVAAIVQSRLEWRLDNHQLSIVLFLGLSILFALVQFQKRGYLHYGLLLYPSFVILCFLAIHLIGRMKPFYAWAFVVGWLIFAFNGLPRKVRHLSNVQSTVLGDRELQVLCDTLQDGQRGIVIPRSYNHIHWQCKTRAVHSKFGYSWAKVDGKELRKMIDSADFILMPPEDFPNNFGGEELTYDEIRIYAQTQGFELRSRASAASVLVRK